MTATVLIPRSLAELPAVLGLRQAAAIAGVHTRTVRRWIGEGRLPSGRTAPKGSGRLRIRTVDLLALLGLPA